MRQNVLFPFFDKSGLVWDCQAGFGKLRLFFNKTFKFWLSIIRIHIVPERLILRRQTVPFEVQVCALSGFFGILHYNGEKAQGGSDESQCRL